MGGVAAEDGRPREGKMEAHVAQKGEAHVGGAGWRGGGSIGKDAKQRGGKEKRVGKRLDLVFKKNHLYLT